MVSISLVGSDSLSPKLCVLISGTYRCGGCVQDFGVNLKNIETRIRIDLSESDISPNGDDERSPQFTKHSLLETFISFILELSSDWWGSEITFGSNDAAALATISAVVPSVEYGASARNAKKLLRKSFASAKQLASKRLLALEGSQSGFDVYDILTEEHFQDLLALIGSLKPTDQAKVTFCFHTEYMRPTICHLHNGHFHRHMHNWKRKGFALLLKVKNALSLRAQSQKLSARLMTKFTHKLQEVYSQLPEINSLLNSGLYTRNYIEHEIDEVYTTITESVIKGFETLRL